MSDRCVKWLSKNEIEKCDVLTDILRMIDLLSDWEMWWMADMTCEKLLWNVMNDCCLVIEKCDEC